ncbi:MAG: peptide chain release factor N(5)-glutamine methyltransferase [Ruminococcus sp.]|nr:peptide chain release factor N(5)-glutamine methyltransferase [Ruminococcus sp.]
MVRNTYSELKRCWTKKFSDSDKENIEFEINELLGMALGIDCRNPLFAEKLIEVADEQIEKRFEKLAARRMNGEPLQYILGEWEFYGLPFKVGEGVLIPRQDTETVVDVAIRKLSDRHGIIVTDLCSGSGCIGIALEKNLYCEKVVCVEKSDKAVEYLRQNVRLNGSEAEVLHGDIFREDVINAVPMSDLIVCNPPYITAEDMQTLQREVTFEPESALFGGEDGLDYYRDITRIYKDKLKNGGLLMFEIGIGQEDEVMRILIQHGFTNVRTRADLLGVNRCVFGEKADKIKLCTDVMSV